MSDFRDYLEKSGEIGRIKSISHSVVEVSGLPNLSLNEMVITEDGKRGMVYGLKEDTAEVLMLDSEDLKVQMPIARTDTAFQIGATPELLGRIVDPLCRPLDLQGSIPEEREYKSIRRDAPNITQRSKVNRFFETGVIQVDLLNPFGYGQRELILGDKKTGKTTFLLQTMANQAKKGTICIYVAIGKRDSDLRMVERYLYQMGALENVVTIAATAGGPSPIIYTAPYSGMSIAEYFRDKGNDVLIIFDDLGTHAKTYRELSLLLKRTPGRSSYPGNIFHIHASLLERAGNVEREDETEASITALPVISTLENDISGYIQTNLMAITDGHIFFDSEEFRKGKKPAINNSLSVSRVGNQTKELLDREMAGIIRRKMSEYGRAQEIARFGVELPEETREILEFGEKLKNIYTQDPSTLISKEFQLFLLGLLISDYWRKKSPVEVEDENAKLLRYYKDGEFSELEKQIKSIKSLDELKTFIKDLLPEIKKL